MLKKKGFIINKKTNTVYIVDSSAFNKYLLEFRDIYGYVLQKTLFID